MFGLLLEFGVELLAFQEFVQSDQLPSLRSLVGDEVGNTRPLGDFHVLGSMLRAFFNALSPVVAPGRQGRQVIAGHCRRG